MKPGHTLEELCRREVSCLKALQNHPCIVPFIGCSLADEVLEPKIVIDYMENGSLENVLADHPNWWTPTKKAIAIFGLVLGMEFAHSRGTIHRDLKPSNLLVDRMYHLRISDFDTGKSNYGRSLQTQQIGTPVYMAPEMYRNEDYDTTVDVFSFGLILYEIIFDQSVFSRLLTPLALMKMVLNNVRAEIPDGVDPWVSNLIQRCWNGAPANRPSFAIIAKLLMEKKCQLFPGVKWDEVRTFVTLVGTTIAHYDRDGNLCEY
jgi:serine/threonine protein kinase